MRVLDHANYSEDTVQNVVPVLEALHASIKENPLIYEVNSEDGSTKTVHLFTDAAKEGSAKESKIGLGFVLNLGDTSVSWGAVLDEGNRESCEGLNGEELKFLKSLSIYELEIFAVDLALHVLEKENLVNSNIVLHVDNVGACFAIRKGAGCKSAAAISAANATKVLGSRGR